MHDDAPTPIPALILSGYLGAGKTTLVGHLLAEAQSQGVKLAIISNEFGDTGIDRALVDAGEEGFVELDGGCVCCRLSDALGETVQGIIEAARPDRLVLECSGVALPGDVQVQFWRPPVDALVTDEVVVAMVDADRFSVIADEALEDTFLEQIEAADLLLLNKVDLVSDEVADAAEARLSELTGGQPVIRCTHGQVDPSLLFPPDPDGARKARRDADAQPRPHTHERFTTHELSFPGIVDPDEVLAQVAAQSAIRAKGFVRTESGVAVLQGVGQRIELSPFTRPLDESLVGRVVIIHREEGHDAHHHD
jgi:cobalamin biosynthesis protein CobW